MEDFAVCCMLQDKAYFILQHVCVRGFLGCVLRGAAQLDLTSFHQNVEGLLGIRTCLVTICSRIRVG